MKAARISPRQAQIMQRICQGRTDKEIAGDLKISQATIKTHLRNIFARLNARSRAQAVMRFLELQ